MTLSGCAFYHSLPLPSGPDLAPSAAAAGAPAPQTPLDMQAVATLAVERNPDLVASRAKADVAKAQAFAAGLLPDPQLSASADQPVPKGFSTGYALGLSEDLQALLTTPARAASADAAADQAKLSALWDEWQTIEKALTLYVQKTAADNKARALADTEAKLSAQAGRSSQALAEHNTTLDQAGADLAAALDTTSQHDAAERDALTAGSGLKSLLALAPDAPLDLADPGDPAPIPKETFQAALTQMPTTRPDLLALQAGYRAQEENVRVAILQQFPSITFGPNIQADTTNVHTVGLAATINLPLFNGARGEIRIQRATRAQLHAEYQARLDQTSADAWRLWQEITLLEGQVHELEARLPEFRKMAETGRIAYQRGDLQPATYLLMQTTLSTRESELWDMRSLLWSDVIALHTLLGSPYVAPPVNKAAP